VESGRGVVAARVAGNKHGPNLKHRVSSFISPASPRAYLVLPMTD
jgi:hypothetical protein